MKQLWMRVFTRIAKIGSDPDDDDDSRLRKSLLVICSLTWCPFFGVKPTFEVTVTSPHLPPFFAHHPKALFRGRGPLQTGGLIPPALHGGQDKDKKRCGARHPAR